MFQHSSLSDSDVFILTVVALIFGFVLGLLADVVLRERGFGPLLNTLIIMAGGLGGILLRAAYYPVPLTSLLVTSLIAAVIAATAALATASLFKKLLTR